MDPISEQEYQIKKSNYSLIMKNVFSYSFKSLFFKSELKILIILSKFLINILPNIDENLIKFNFFNIISV
jgi:hypothetical protein